VSRRRIPAHIRENVRRRARFLCEYCHTSERWQYIPFTLDHIIPVKAGGGNALNNLALACFHCNRRKSAYETAVDPQTDKEVPLFNPRKQEWGDHFIWSKDRLFVVGRTATGRATVALLELNRPRVLPIREDDLTINRHPPQGDPIKRK
jgi:5-methylcytosine-specific restriction endonuclease McrA